MKTLIIFYLLLISYHSDAHEGHDHGTTKPPATFQLEPRIELSSKQVELLAVVQANEVKIYLDDFKSNLPINAAKIEVEVDNKTVKAEAVGEGEYSFFSEPLQKTGEHELIFSLEFNGLNDLLIGNLTIPAPPEAKPQKNALDLTAVLTDKKTMLFWSGWLTAFLLLLLFIFTRKESKQAMVLAFASLLFLVGLYSPLVVAQTPSRLSDGRVFLPKSIQHELNMTTHLISLTDHEKWVELTGHVMADPNYSGQIQATQTGRIERGDHDFPHLGKKIRAGEVLAWLDPILSNLDNAEQAAILVEIEGEIQLAQQKYDRLKQIKGVTPQATLDELLSTLKSLRQKKATLSQKLQQRTVLKAPVTGIIRSVSANVGQIVEARDVLFELFNPDKLWVNAITFDSNLARKIKAARAITAEGQNVPLKFLGSGHQLQGHGVPLQFQALPPLPALSIEQPLKVLVAMDEKTRGYTLSRKALSRNINGETVV